MKTYIRPLLWLLLLSCAAKAQVASRAPESSPSSIVVDVGPHHRVWQTVTTDDQGQTITNSYTELATALNFFNPATETWEESQEAFEIDGNGYAVAQKGQHRLTISPWLNDANGAVDLEAPDGERFRSTILGLSLYDRLSGRSLLIAELTNSVGELIAPNQILFRSCFDTLDADVKLTHQKGRFHQDVILHEALDLNRLEELGFSPETSRLEIWTEFFQSPSPTVNARVVESESDPDLRALMAEPDVIEEDLDFGVMKMPSGRAYLEEAAMNLQQAIAVPKHWISIDGRTFLVESMSLDALRPLFASLPMSRSGLANLRKSPRHEKSYVGRQPPAPSLFETTTNAIMLAKAEGRTLGRKGIALDYVTVNGSSTNYTFKGDTTYYINGTLDLYGTTTIEGGAILKYATNTPYVVANGPISCLTSSYRPAVFTAKDDNSIGDTISGSTGTPSGEYAYIGLYAFNVSAAITLQYLRMAHASYGVLIESNSGGSSIRHCQFVKVGTPLYVYSTTAAVQNVLIHQAATTAIYGELSTINAEHLTIHNANKVFDTGTLNLTNSLLVTITNSGTSFNGAYNATNPSGGVFTIVGSASHYLADSAYRNIGKTNISSNLAADLKKLTTYPPIVLTNHFSVSTTLNPQAQRDTDAPDLGYHYDPLDYCLSDLNLTSATLTLTNGVAVGFYGTNGLILKAGSILVSEGTPSNLNRIARFHTVQEQPTVWVAKGNAMLTMTGTYTPLPIVSMRFTDIPAMGLATTSPGDRTLIYEINNILESLTLVDCQLRGSTMYYTPHNDPYTSSVLMTNNLAERSNFYVQRSGTPTALTVNFRNNLFWQTGFYLVYDFRSGGSNPTWDIKDNVFDNCSMTEGGTNYTSYILNSYNGYVGTAVLLASSGGNDQTPTNFTYAVGALGPWYQSSTNMIDKGSVTNAALAGLYHYTTQTSQAKEANTRLDIGFHYVAVDGNGNPLDYDSDGIGDYLEDRNGNGNVVPDTGETNWQDKNDLGLKVWITEPKNNSNIP